MRKILTVASFLLLFASPAAAYRGDCGQPHSDGPAPTLRDVIYMLKATSHGHDCDEYTCDVNSDCRVSVTDALHLLFSMGVGDRDLVCHDGCDEELLCGDTKAPMCDGYCPEGFGCTEVEKPRKKRRVCHKGLIFPWRAKTIEVGRKAVEKHLGHGDYLGRCRDGRGYMYDEDDDSDSGKGSDDDSDSKAGDKDDSDSDSDSEKKPKKVKTMCRCRPEPPVTTTLPHATTTTTYAEPTTTTIPEPTTTTTLPDPTTTTTVPRPTTTTTYEEPTTTTTTYEEPPTTTMPDGTTTTTMPMDFDNDGMDDGNDPCPTDPRNLCYGPVAMDVASELPIRINANSDPSDACSGARTDCSGAIWVDDFGYSLPSVSDVCSLPDGCPLEGIDAAFGCSDAPTEDLIRCERFANTYADHPPLTYSFAVADGEYLVNLYFANTFAGTALPGSRVFDIVVEGDVVYEDFDQILAAGGSGIVVIRSAMVSVVDGTLDVGFMSKVENAAVKAIEVLAAP